MTKNCHPNIFLKKVLTNQKLSVIVITVIVTTYSESGVSE